MKDDQRKEEEKDLETSFFKLSLSVSCLVAADVRLALSLSLSRLVKQDQRRTHAHTADPKSKNELNTDIHSPKPHPS